jgi:hypothetical protein
MALSTVVTPLPVTRRMPDMFDINLRMVYADTVGGVVTILIDKPYSEPFKTGQAWSTTVTARMRARMKADIANYKLEQAIFNGAPLAACVENLNSTVGV